MAYRELSNVARSIQRASQFRESPHLFGSYRSYSRVLFNNADRINNGIGGIFSSQQESQHASLFTRSLASIFIHGKTTELSIVPHGARTVTVQAKPPAQSRQMAAMQVTMLSPGFVYEPYTIRESLPFRKRWFTRSGWKRTKEDIILELKSAYAIAKLRKKGYSKQKFYTEAIELYKEINFLLTHGDKKNLRKKVTDRMYFTIKNVIRQREIMWSKVYWEMVEPVVKIRTLRARLIAVDRNDTNKVFCQLTIEFLTKQKFEAYDSNGTVVDGNKNKEELVKDIWVFEKSLFQTGAYWRLCGEIVV